MLPAIISGTVKPFKGNGRKLGYPTANLRTDTDLKDGVYFGFGRLREYEHQPALIFIGTPETMGDTERRIEAYLLDIPDQDYYEEELSLSVEHFHRGNRKFDSIDELKAIMADDELEAAKWFASEANL